MKTPHRNQRRGLLSAILLLSSIPVLHAQLPAGTGDASSSTRQPPSDPLRAQAAEALDHQDFRAALPLLTQLAARYPTDPRILFNLASTQDALSDSDPSQAAAAEASYRRAIAADPNVLEPHLALGLLLARTSHPAEARTELTAATTLNSPDSTLRARAFRALAHLDQTSDPAAARDALIAALKLTPETPEDTLLSAELAEQAHDAPAAEAAYRRILARTPGDPAAAAALAHLLLSEDKASEAEPLLNTALAAHPNDPALTSQLASLYLRQNKPAEASALIEKLHAARPDDPAITRMYARLLSQAGQYDRSEPLLAALLAGSPNDLVLLDDEADALIHLKRSPEAQRLLQPAVARPGAFPTPADLASAASHLAFAASQNNDPETTLRALQIRGKVLPQSAPSLFLEATAHDRLHHGKQAKDLYRQFLSVADGKFPDEEWEARHRLVTLDHMK